MRHSWPGILTLSHLLVLITRVDLHLVLVLILATAVCIDVILHCAVMLMLVDVVVVMVHVVVLLMRHVLVDVLLKIRYIAVRGAQLLQQERERWPGEEGSRATKG